MNNQILIHPTVAHTIARVLAAHRYPKDEIERAIAEVCARALESIEGSRRGPKTVGDWQLHAADIAATYCTDERGLPPCDDIDFDVVDDAPDPEGPPDPERMLIWCLVGDPRSQTQRQVAVLLDMLDHGELPEKSREILESLAGGATVPEAGRAVGLHASEVREGLRQMRTRFFRRLVKVGLLHAQFDEEVGEGRATDSETQRGKR